LIDPSSRQPAPRRVDPTRLTLLLEDAGWRLVGGRPGIYNRFAAPGQASGRHGSLVVPLDPSAPEFEELMLAALSELAAPAYRDIWQRVIAPRLATEAADRLRFAKESPAPSGLIAWREGEELIESARSTLVAGAKSYMGPERHHGNRHGKFARRYLDTVLMGQTAAGSYVVTAFAPANVAVPLKGGQFEGFGLEGMDIARARQVTLAVVRAVEAVTEALHHYRATGSFSGFDEGVELGVSYEMAAALNGGCE